MMVERPPSALRPGRYGESIKGPIHRPRVYPTAPPRCASGYHPTVTTLTLDPARSQVRIRTFAEGLFARLAHDLELVCRDIAGSAERSDAAGDTARLEIPISKIDVAGALRSGRLDPDGLSANDRADCLGKMRSDVFHAHAGASDVVRVEGTLERGKARVRVATPNGRMLSRSIDVRVEPEGNEVRVRGRADLSLEALGSDAVRGPMNAFRVKDTIEVLFDLVFVEDR